MGNIKVLLGFSLIISSMSAAPGSLGIVSSESLLKLNGATVPSNGAVFDGSTLEPGTAALKLQMADGGFIRLAPGSKGKFFAGHMELEKGEMNLMTRTPYRVDVRSYRISVVGENSMQSISLSGSTLNVNSIRGNASVRNAGNVLLASVAAGRTLTFTQSGEDRSRVTGPVRWAKGAATLEDETTHVQFRLVGASALATANLDDRYSGRVEAVGVARALSDSENTLAVQRVTLLAANMTPQTQTPGQSPTRVLSIVVEEGEGAINNIRERTARETIVRVEDENHRPVAGAAVLFVMPGSGPSGTFANGSNVFRAVTDSTGRAHALIKPNAVPGKYQVSVSASSNGAMATAIVAEVNAAFAGVAAGAVGAATAGTTATASAAVVAGVAVAAVAGPIAAIVVNGTAPAPQVSTGVIIP